MMPTLIPAPFSHSDWLFEPKLDGFRTIAFIVDGCVKLQTRRGFDATSDYPAVANELRRQPRTRLILDGEIVALDDEGRVSFERLCNRRNRQTPILYYIFDLLHLDGQDLGALPLDQRKQLLHADLEQSDCVRLVESFPKDGEAVYQAAVANGMEGVVAKRRDSVYEAGQRSRKWLKAKMTRTAQFVICGYAAAGDSFSTLALGMRLTDGRLVWAGEVGTGFERASKRELALRLRSARTDASPLANPPPENRSRWSWSRSNPSITWVLPEMVAEVRYAEQSDDGNLRAPVFLRLVDSVPR